MSNSQENCRVCGAADGTVMTTARATYWRCNQCDTLQKIMTEAEYLAMDPGYDPGAFLDNGTEAEIRAYLKVNQYRRVLEDALAETGRTPAGMSMLDVGCGMGAYMIAARDLGMQVRGFEPSKSHAHVAVDVLKLDVEGTYFAPAAVGEDRFDLIVLSHVIEHIYKPGPFVADLLSVLKPDGMLLMVTPNASSLTAKLTGAHWPMLVPIDHVTMMSKTSFGKLVPADARLTVKTSEYPHEFAATFGSIAKSMLKGAPVNTSDMAVKAAPKLMREVSWRSRVLQVALTLVSLPFHLVARATNNAAALVVRVEPGQRAQ